MRAKRPARLPSDRLRDSIPARGGDGGKSGRVWLNEALAAPAVACGLAVSRLPLLRLYIGLAAISFRFGDGDGRSTHPARRALLCAGDRALLARPGPSFVRELSRLRRRCGIILGFAVASRLLLLSSWPIQEIDYYRYLWDGRVTLGGHQSVSLQSRPDRGSVSLAGRPPDELALLAD